MFDCADVECMHSICFIVLISATVSVYILYYDIAQHRVLVIFSWGIAL